MADIFISYARADRAKIEKLASALEAEGHSLWWDRHIEGGAQYSKDIEAALTDARAVIVAWSERAVESTWVQDEALTARDQGKLIPITLDGSPAPMGFKQFHLIDFEAWDGKADDAAFADLSRAVKARITGQAAPRPVQAASLKKPVRLAGLHPSIFIVGIVALAIVSIVAMQGPEADPPPKPAAGTTSEMPVAATPVNEIAVRDGAATRGAMSASDASIAVLPFADLSADGSQEYFADGIAEEILNVLAKIDTLEVTSRTSAFAFKSKSTLSIPDIADTLGVRHILEGSVRTSGDTIRITAQLIDAQSDQHLWSETFDRKLTAENIFAIQDEIAAAITDELSARMGGAVIDLPSVKRGTNEIDAYETFLRGRDLFINRNYQNLELAVDELTKSVAADPEFARAWGWLSMAYAVAPAWGFFDRDYPALAYEAANQALALDPQNGSAYTALGYRAQNLKTPTGYAQAIENYEKAIAADPKATTAYLWLSQAFRELGFFDRAMEAVEKCLELDPNYPVCIYTYAEITMMHGDYDLAIERLMPIFATPHAESYPAFLGATAAQGDDILLVLMLRELADIVSPDARWMVKDLQRALSEENYDRAAALARLEARLDAEFPDAQGRSDPYTVSAYRLAFRAYDKMPDAYAAEGWWWFRGYPGLENSDYARAEIKKRNIAGYWWEYGFPPQCRPVGTDDFECD